VPPAAPATALSVARELVARHGLARGLYRGTAPVLAGVAPVFALCFWSFAQAKSLLRELSGARSDRELSLVAVGLAGALSAVPTTVIMAPGERVKIVLQTNASFRGGAADVARHLLRTGGVRSLFRGSAATLLRDGAGSTAYFAVYEGVRRALAPAVEAEPPTAAVLLAGGLAGVANWCVALPIDAVKSRIQLEAIGAGAGAAPPPASAMRSVAARLYREGGAAAFYRGLGPVLLRAFPANAACFFAMETSRAALDKAF
jgi:solute carrier family 25 carnitine/acylcarnitine transporter 20/29